MKKHQPIEFLFAVSLFSFCGMLLSTIRHLFFNHVLSNLLYYYLIVIILFVISALSVIFVKEKLSNQPSLIFLRNLKIICAILIGIVVARWLSLLL